MRTITIYTVIPYRSTENEVFLNDVKSFTSYEKASHYMHDQFGYANCDITVSELEID